MIKAVLLDFDGVLFQSVGIKTEAFYSMFMRYGEETANKVVNHHLVNGGVSRFEKLKLYYSDFLKEDVSDDFLKEKAEEFSLLVKKKVIESIWVEGASQFLTQYKGVYDLFVVSGTPLDELMDIVNRKSISHFFLRLYGSPQSKTENIETLMKTYGYNRDEVVFVGDSLTDYQGATNNKISFIGVGDFFKGTEYKVPYIADLTSLGEVIINLDQVCYKG